MPVVWGGGEAEGAQCVEWEAGGRARNYPCRVPGKLTGANTGPGAASQRSRRHSRAWVARRLARESRYPGADRRRSSPGARISQPTALSFPASASGRSKDAPRRRPPSPGATAEEPATHWRRLRGVPAPSVSPPPPPPLPGSASSSSGSRLRRRHRRCCCRPGPSQRPPRRSRVAAGAAARGPAMSGSAAAAVAAAAASAAAAAAHFQPQSSSPRPGPTELGPPRRPRPPPPPPRPEPAAAGRLSPPGHGPLRAGAQGGGACGRAPGAGTGSSSGPGGRGVGWSRGRGPQRRVVQPRSGWSVVRVSFVRPRNPCEPCVPAAPSGSQSIFPPGVEPPPLVWPRQHLSKSPLGGGGN